MKTAFTPGPWACAQSICDGGDVSFDIHQVEIGSELAPVSDVAYSRLFKTYASEHLEVQKANARLIASAPELLAIAKKIKAHGTVSASWIEELNAAISKATGDAA